MTLPGTPTRHTSASKVAGLLRRYAPRNDGFYGFRTLHQAATGTEEEQNINNQFSPGFFDRVIIDVGRNPRADQNVHAPIHPRGFRCRVRRTATLSVLLALRWNPHGEGVRVPPNPDPIYTYSLRQGSSDGFLAPYKVVRIGIDKDLDGWRPEIGQTDNYGNTIEDRESNDSDYDRHLILEKRTTLTAAARGTNRSLTGVEMAAGVQMRSCGPEEGHAALTKRYGLGDPFDTRARDTMTR